MVTWTKYQPQICTWLSFAKHPIWFPIAITPHLSTIKSWFIKVIQTLIWCSFMCGSHRSLANDGRLSLQHSHIKRALCYFSLHTGRRITYLPLTPKCLLYLFPQCLFKEISHSGARIQRGAKLTVMYKFLFYVQAIWQEINAVWTATFCSSGRTANSTLAITLNPIGLLAANHLCRCSM